VYAGLLDRLGVWDVTVIGNSIGGWIAAELALASGHGDRLPEGHPAAATKLDRRHLGCLSLATQ
jgi:pimeloyl-ACP methyl ester carboxylesterase